MIRRRFWAVVALLIAWGCFGVVLSSAFDLMRERCQQFGNLSAECFAPYVLMMSAFGLIFLLATTALAILAMRPPKMPNDL
jgi:hypothetical protein